MEDEQEDAESALGDLSGGLSNHYLFDLMSKTLSLDRFAGVFAADTIPKKVLTSRGMPLLCIVNTAKLSERGRHFITLLIKKDEIIVLDSLSLDLADKSRSLERRLNRSGKHITNAFSAPMQSDSSLMCGVYCAYFCMFLRRREFPDRSSLKPLKYGQLAANDKAVVHNVSQLIKNNV